MNETNLIIQNRLREATISLERANLIICDETWKCDSSVPPFPAFSSSCRGREPSASMRQPSIQQADSCICSPPTRTRRFLPISIIHTAPTIAISRSPASRPTCSNSFICRSASTRKTRKRPNSFSSISSTASDRMISFLR